jgi:uncharacterized membrane protein YphA (DoxX/SURF4 family)
MWKRIINTDAARSTALIRLLVGSVFLSEGIQKFLIPHIRGSGRFKKIGLPEPEMLGNLVGAFEIICGLMVLLGLITRIAVIPLFTIMIAAFITTKWEILNQQGIWEWMHASRTDWSMTVGSIFLWIKGSGAWSVDRKLLNQNIRWK